MISYAIDMALEPNRTELKETGGEWQATKHLDLARSAGTPAMPDPLIHLVHQLVSGLPTVTPRLLRNTYDHVSILWSTKPLELRRLCFHPV
jgi:hypothetical protein